jgi:hypothetical protein
MSKKSVVLLAGLGLAATAAGAWIVRMRSTQIDEIQTDPIATETVPAPRADTPLAAQWTGDNEDDTLAGELAAGDDEPVNVR